MFSYIWPIALAVLSNVVYHVSSKSVPENEYVEAYAKITEDMAAQIEEVIGGGDAA